VQRRSDFRGVILSVACVAIALFFSTSAFADARTEAAAKALQKKAMEEDYLATDFAKSQEKLKEAIAKCGNDKCSPLVRAQLRRDLGVVLIGGQVDKNKGEAAFAEAIAIDASLQLDPDLKTKELEAAWEAAHKGGGASATTASARPSGDFTHTPAAQEQVRTPLPIYAEYAGSEALVKVIARYKGFGMTEFKTLELKKLDSGWGGMIPCADVQQGDFQYYLQGFNEANDPVATAGDRSHPYKVPVKGKIDGEIPHLPNQPAPTQCAEAGDCPPDFPGCKKGGAVAETPAADVEPDGKDEGGVCEEDSDCKSRECKHGACTAYEGAKKTKFKRNWIGISGSLDLLFVNSANDACKLNAGTGLPLSSYYCTNSDGSDFPARSAADPKGVENGSIVTGRPDADVVHGGMAAGDVRLALSYDYAVNANLMIGGRVGFVIGGYNGTAAKNDGNSFPPFMLEARGTYIIGKDALEHTGLRPYVLVGGGISEFAAKVSVSVVEQQAMTNTLSSKSVNAWRIAGPAFIGIGGGVRYAFTEASAVYFAPIRLNIAFGGSGSALPMLSPELGVQFGF
jgi:hypothetical protein